MARPIAGGSLTNILWLQLNSLYDLSIREIAQSNKYREGINGFSGYALAVIPMTITYWESFLNEKIINNLNFVDHCFKDILSDLDKLTPLQKTIVLPKIVFGVTFDKESEVYKDLSKIVSLRNTIIHYKSDEYPKSQINYLNQKKFILPTEEGHILAYPLELCSTEVIRWCINTAWGLVDFIFSLFFEQTGIKEGESLFVKQITSEEAKEKFINNGIDIETPNFSGGF